MQSGVGMARDEACDGMGTWRDHVTRDGHVAGRATGVQGSVLCASACSLEWGGGCFPPAPTKAPGMGGE